MIKIFWISATNGEIPDGAIVCGKVRKEFDGANIPYGGKVITVNNYEVLVAE